MTFDITDFHDEHGNLLPVIAGPSSNGNGQRLRQEPTPSQDRRLENVEDEARDITEAERLFAQMPADVKEQAYTVLYHEDPLNVAVEDVHAIGAIGEERLIETLYLTATSRLLARPLSVIVQGGSSSGKSYTVKCVADAIPPESKVLAVSITPNALYLSLIHISEPTRPY